METEILIDTHVFVWLYSGDLDQLSKRAEVLIESSEICVSPLSILETDYLQEVKKFKQSGKAVFCDLEKRIGLKLAQDPLEKLIEVASKQKWTRDAFDRLIVSQAIYRECRLLTKDRHIQQHYSKAIW